jgi:hypothetical protein
LWFDITGGALVGADAVVVGECSVSAEDGLTCDVVVGVVTSGVILGIWIER